MSKVYIITGANAGLGKDAARQLLLRDDTAKVYLACRTESKAKAAIDELVDKTKVDASKVAYMHFDSCDDKKTIESDAATAITESFVHGLVLNAGGMGDDATPHPTEPNGVTNIAQTNLIGHIHLLDYLKSKKKIGSKGGDKTRIVFSGSEAARGVPVMGIKPTHFDEKKTVEEYKDVLTGKAYAEKYDKMVSYAEIKAMGALYFAGYARANPDMDVFTVSPGGTTGTNMMNSSTVSAVEKVMFSIFMPVLSLFGAMHKLEVGAKRYVDGVTGDDFDFKSGTFVASKAGMAGCVVDQTEVSHGEVFGNVEAQDMAFEAVNAFA